MLSVFSLDNFHPLSDFPTNIIRPIRAVLVKPVRTKTTKKVNTLNLITIF